MEAYLQAIRSFLANWLEDLTVLSSYHINMLEIFTSLLLRPPAIAAVAYGSIRRLTSSQFEPRK